MKLRQVVVVLIALLGLVAGGFAQKVSVDYDRDADFSKYKKYAWAEGVRASDSLMDKRIVEAIDAQLTAKGWTKVAPDQSPDAYVLYQAAVSEETQATVWGTGYGAGWRRTGGTTQITTETILIGQLVVEIGDAASKQLVWRGKASDTLSDKPEKNEKKIKKAAEKMFKNFPPAKK